MNRRNRVKHRDLPCVDPLGNKGQFQKQEELPLGYSKSPPPADPNKIRLIKRS